MKVRRVLKQISIFALIGTILATDIRGVEVSETLFYIVNIEQQ